MHEDEVERDLAHAVLRALVLVIFAGKVSRNRPLDLRTERAAELLLVPRHLTRNHQRPPPTYQNKGASDLVQRTRKRLVKLGTLQTPPTTNSTPPTAAAPLDRRLDVVQVGLEYVPARRLHVQQILVYEKHAHRALQVVHLVLPEHVGRDVILEPESGGDLPRRHLHHLAVEVEEVPRNLRFPQYVTLCAPITSHTLKPAYELARDAHVEQRVCDRQQEQPPLRVLVEERLVEIPV
ncbi:fasciclin-like arabinogalactan protein ARB_02922 [Babesia caballi]|uniref:Fasciclin-like arabinogalactan protein ARB_02922 n=1 Tax=Babesia caballi TaxID=5871 RepID=A0AAV4LPK5_BABCB|nr:fasciclin-like arabinogalactan protein ARB_02922 [Babesia caballi]